jgi:hypothetical protein
MIREVHAIKIGLPFYVYDIFENSFMQTRLKFKVEYLKTRGAQNSSDNRIEFLASLLVRISCQMNFSRLNRTSHPPPGMYVTIARKKIDTNCIQLSPQLANLTKTMLTAIPFRSYYV